MPFPLLSLLPLALKVVPKVINAVTKGTIKNAVPTGVKSVSGQEMLIDEDKVWWRSKHIWTFMTVGAVGALNLALGWDFSANDLNQIVTSIDDIGLMAVGVTGIIRRARAGK